MKTTSKSVLGKTITAIADPAPPPGKAARVKIDIAKKSNADAAAMAATVLTHMENNPNFPSPLPADATLQTALDTLVETIAAADVARRASVAATGAMDTARAALDLILTQRGSYVDLVANGDPNVILSSGFQLRANPTPVGDLAAPANLSVELNGTPGLMLLTWEGVEKARAYNLQISPASTPARTWAPLLTSSTTKTRLDDLKLGQLYAFRVAAVGGATGQSPWSIEAVRMAA